MLADAIKKLEDNSVRLLEECLAEIRDSGSAEIRTVPADDLKVALYLLTLKQLEFLKQQDPTLSAESGNDMKSVFLDAARRIVQGIDNSTPYTVGHSEAVARHAGLLASRMKLSDADIAEIEYAAHIHNIGLINSSQRIMSQRRTLTDEELSLARNHCVVGAEILRPIEFLSNMVPMVRYHHTRFDGTGYPGGLAGDDLPLGARIIGVADAYQAMRSERPHRSALSREQAIAEIEKNAGKQFDPRLVVFVHDLRDTY